MSYSSIIAEALRIIKDPNATRWTKEEIKGYIDQGQRKLATSSLNLEGTQHYTGDSSLDNNYPLPDDFLEFISFITPKGVEIEILSTQALVRDNTYKFLTDMTSNSISAVCLNFGSWNEIRFYPNPDNNLDVGTMRYKRLPRPNDIEVEDEDPLIFFALSRMYLKERSKEGFKQSSFFFDKYSKIERSLMKNRKDNFKHKPFGSFF